MSTITYKNQPAIHKTRGSIPLSGNSHLYKVDKLLWPEDVGNFLSTLLIGTVLHVCHGKSKLGDIRLDMFEDDTNVIGDAARLPFPSDSFGTVLIDPPYNGKFQWNHDMISETARVAGTRFIFQHWFSPVDKLGRFKKDHSFQLVQLHAWMPKSYFGRMQIISVFDRRS